MSAAAAAGPSHSDLFSLSPAQSIGRKRVLPDDEPEAQFVDVTPSPPKRPSLRALDTLDTAPQKRPSAFDDELAPTNAKRPRATAQELKPAAPLTADSVTRKRHAEIDINDLSGPNESVGGEVPKRGRDEGPGATADSEPRSKRSKPVELAQDEKAEFNGTPRCSIPPISRSQR